MPNDFVPVIAASPVLEQPQQIRMQAFLDVNPEQFPNGCEIIIMRPGELTAVGSIPLPVGVLLMLIDVETANHMRDKHRADIEAQRKAMARGALGRRG